MTDYPELHQTKDGSSTLYSSRFGQFYHNPNGAVSESRHVFFDKSGLNNFFDTARTLTILEMGFGTGLNFLLLLDEYKKRNLDMPVHFWSVEAFPVSKDTAAQFNFREHLEHPGLNNLLPDIFSSLKPGMNSIKPVAGQDVELNLFYGIFDEFSPNSLDADFIFHDPFSPDVNEELWTKEVFDKLAGYSKQDTVLSTYCAASQARGAMCAAGWFVAREQGALGKREMTVASLNPEKLSHLKRVNEKRLAERYQKDDF